EFLDLRFFPSLGFFLWDSFWRLRPGCSIISSTVAAGKGCPYLGQSRTSKKPGGAQGLADYSSDMREYHQFLPSSTE
ncbi:hypothetical protein NDU88_000530, partial [Pleurodeles waltl]